MIGLSDAGMIVYDVPDSHRDFRNFLRRKLRDGRALPVNKSVYAVKWGDVPRYEAIIAHAKRKHEIENDWMLQIHIIKFDDVTAEKAGEMALIAMRQMIGQVRASLAAKLKKMEAKGEHEFSRTVQISFVRKLVEVENLAMAFAMSDDVEIALEAARRAVEAQIGAEVAEKFLKNKTSKPPVAATA